MGRAFTAEQLYMNPFSKAFNGVLFSLLFALMIVAHVQCVITNPGILPRGYEALKEEQLPLEFQQLINERENIFHEQIVRKKLRNNDPELVSQQASKMQALSSNARHSLNGPD